MNMKSHGIAEDLAPVIGYTATAALVDWFGGGNLAIPASMDESHPIARVIGFPAASRLSKEWGGETLWLPLGYQREQDRRDRMIAVLLHMGLGSKQVALISTISERQVQMIRKRVEEMGVLPLILKRAGITENRFESWSKSPGRLGHKGKSIRKSK